MGWSGSIALLGGESDMSNELPSLILALRFHEIYEKEAPNFGYTTREDTKEFDPKSNNGKLMIEVCRQILSEQDHGT